MKILVFGALNYDFVYPVDHMVLPGETLLAENMQVFCGGKGLNQAIALSRAGVEVHLAGTVGTDGGMLLGLCKSNGIMTDDIATADAKSGHAIIQLDKSSQNSIILYGGANRMQKKEQIDRVLANYGEGDLLLLQNEINLLDYIAMAAAKRKMTIVLNPSPFDGNLTEGIFCNVGIFIMNEVEGSALTGEPEPKKILARMRTRFPAAKTVLTVGAEGAYYFDGRETYYQPAFRVDAVDTTGAGDTFTGYFVSGLSMRLPVEALLLRASKAAAIAVSRMGATSSIPTSAEVDGSRLSELRR